VTKAVAAVTSALKKVNNKEDLKKGVGIAIALYNIALNIAPAAASSLMRAELRTSLTLGL